MGILYPLGFEEQKNPALKDGIRHRIQNLRSLKQKTDGTSRSSAQIENIKRQSLFRLFRAMFPIFLRISSACSRGIVVDTECKSAASGLVGEC